MKVSKTSAYSKAHAALEFRFENQKFTSFSGLTVFQGLFDKLQLKKWLCECFRHRKVNNIFSDATIVLLLVVHLLLGYRELKHVKYYKGGPIVKRLLGLNRLPGVSTISRCLSSVYTQSVKNIQATITHLVLGRIDQ